MQFYAKDIMSRHLVVAKPEMMCEAVMELLIANRISGVPVVDAHGSLVGVISMTDIMITGMNFPYTPNYFEEARIDKLLADEGFHVEAVSDGYVSDFMNRTIYTATPSTPVEALATTMYQHHIHRVIIVDDDHQKPVGIVTTYDLLKLMAESNKSLAPS